MTNICEGAAAFNIKGDSISSVRSGFSCVKIPSTIKYIAGGNSENYAFKSGISEIKQIDFSEATGLEEIGDFSFANCALVSIFNLSKCTLLSKIGYMAFSNCAGCSSIVLSEDSPLELLSGGAFYGCSSLTSFTVPQNVVTIDTHYLHGTGNEGVFTNCLKLTSIIFAGDEPKIQSIGVKAFFLSGIVSIRFPASLRSINGESFRGCHNLEKIEVDPKNPIYSAVDGVLLSDNGTALVYYPDKACESETAVLPKSVTKIRRYSFIGDNNYKSIDLTNVEVFDQLAFDRVDCNSHIKNTKKV